MLLSPETVLSFAIEGARKSVQRFEFHRRERCGILLALAEVNPKLQVGQRFSYVCAVWSSCLVKEHAILDKSAGVEGKPDARNSI